MSKLTGGDFIVPVDFVKRIQVETEIELAAALLQNLRLGLGPQLGVKRNLLGPAQVGLNDQRAKPSRDLQFRKNTRRYRFRRGNALHVEILHPGRIGDRSDQLFQVFPQLVRFAPRPGPPGPCRRDQTRTRRLAPCRQRGEGRWRWCHTARAPDFAVDAWLPPHASAARRG